MVLILAMMSGASCAYLSSTTITPSLVGITATLPPGPMMTQRLLVTLLMVRGCRGCCCAQASQRPAIPRAAKVIRRTSGLRKTMEENISQVTAVLGRSFLPLVEPKIRLLVLDSPENRRG